MRSVNIKLTINLLWIFFPLFLMLNIACAGHQIPGNEYSQPSCPAFSEAHQTLYNEYQSGHEILSRYAKEQGFPRLCENRLTVLHEIIHIDSAIKKAYFMNGRYLGPYLLDGTWLDLPLKNKDVLSGATIYEKLIMNSLDRLYLSRTPNNHMGNILDEINAYTQTLPYVSEQENGTIQKQVKGLSGHLGIMEAYLRLLRTEHPRDYVALAHRKAGKLLRVIVTKGWVCLDKAGLEKKDVPLTEAERFFEMLRENHEND